MFRTRQITTLFDDTRKQCSSREVESKIAIFSFPPNKFIDEAQVTVYDFSVNSSITLMCAKKSEAHSVSPFERKERKKSQKKSSRPVLWIPFPSQDTNKTPGC